MEHKNHIALFTSAGKSYMALEAFFMAVRRWIALVAYAVAAGALVDARPSFWNVPCGTGWSAGTTVPGMSRCDAPSLHMQWPCPDLLHALMMLLASGILRVGWMRPAAVGVWLGDARCCVLLRPVIQQATAAGECKIEGAPAV